MAKAVFPPELEWNHALISFPSCVRTFPRVSFTAALIASLTFSGLYSWAFSNPAWISEPIGPFPPLSSSAFKANVLATIAWAARASCGQWFFISPATTAATYSSMGSSRTLFSVSIYNLMVGSFPSAVCLDLEIPKAMTITATIPMPIHVKVFLRLSVIGTHLES